MGRFYKTLQSLPHPLTGYYFQLNGITSIIKFSLLFGTYQIVTDIDIENVFYVVNREDRTYMKYTRCTTSNLYTYIVRVGEESEVLLNSIVEGKGNKLLPHQPDLC